MSQINNPNLEAPAGTYSLSSPLRIWASQTSRRVGSHIETYRGWISDMWTLRCVCRRRGGRSLTLRAKTSRTCRVLFIVMSSWYIQYFEKVGFLQAIAMDSIVENSIILAGTPARGNWQGPLTITDVNMLKIPIRCKYGEFRVGSLRWTWAVFFE